MILKTGKVKKNIIGKREMEETYSGRVSLVREENIPYQAGNITGILSRGVKEGLFTGHLMHAQCAEVDLSMVVQ
jgi:hypothetical protein